MRNAGFIRVYFLGMIGVVAVLALASGARYYLVMTLGERVVADLRGDLFAHLTRLDPGFFDAEKTGEIVSRLSADTTQLKATFGSSASIALRNLFLFVGAIGDDGRDQPETVGLCAGRDSGHRAAAVRGRPGGAPALAPRAGHARRRDRLRDREPRRGARHAGVRRGERLPPAASARPPTAPTRRRASMAQARAFVTAAALFLAFGSVVMVLWLGAQDVVAGRMTGGALLQFVLFAVFGASSLGQLSEVWNEVSAGRRRGGADRRTAGGPPADRRARPSAAAAAARRAARSPSMRRLRLSADRTRTVLQRRRAFASCRAKSSRSSARPAPASRPSSSCWSGSTIPTRGVVTLDGVDISKLDPKALRREIALVPQDAFIFGASVADNIAYGAPDATRGAIVAAARSAAADGFIAALPQGYDTLLGERGVTLSGGERQRLAIARAILKNAPVLLLDEATSALDAENETLVQGALDALMKGRTTLVIAHRLSTIVNADRILVIDAGSIVEEGTHARCSPPAASIPASPSSSSKPAPRR